MGSPPGARGCGPHGEDRTGPRREHGPGMQASTSSVPQQGEMEVMVSCWEVGVFPQRALAPQGQGQLLPAPPRAFLWTGTHAAPSPETLPPRGDGAESQPGSGRPRGQTPGAPAARAPPGRPVQSSSTPSPR